MRPRPSRVSLHGVVAGNALRTPIAVFVLCLAGACGSEQRRAEAEPIDGGAGSTRDAGAPPRDASAGDAAAGRGDGSMQTPDARVAAGDASTGDADGGTAGGSADAGAAAGAQSEAGAGGTAGTGMTPCWQVVLMHQTDCEFEFTGPGVDPGEECKGRLTLNGSDLPCNGPNGWRLLDSHHLELVGAACTAFTSSSAAVLQLTFPCSGVP